MRIAHSLRASGLRSNKHRPRELRIIVFNSTGNPEEFPVDFL